MNRNQMSRNEPNFHQHAYQRYLEEQLDWITVEHDDLREELNEQFSTPKYHPSMSTVDQWEKEMIENIRRMAVFARRTLIFALDQNAFQVKKNMDQITPALRDARAGIRPFTERDLKEWMMLLRQWRRVPALPVRVGKSSSVQELTIDLRDDSSKSFAAEQIQYYGLISIIHPSPSHHTHQQQTSTSPRSETITPGGIVIIREQ